MTVDIVIPALGIAMEEALLVQWLKQPGDEITAGEPVAEIETDKATMELTSPVSGQLGTHLYEPGTTVAVGAAIVRVVVPGEDPAVAVASAGNAEAAEEAAWLIAIALDGVPVGDLAGWLEDMVVIRGFEESLEVLTSSGKIPGGAHQATGQEAVAVGVMRALATQDILASPHRPHHHALAKGLSARAVMAELWGRATGCAGGRGGTMHLSDFSRGYFGSNGIVGASLGIAMGAALAAKLRHTDQVCVGIVGDGGANTGRTWEFVNFAAVQTLPLIAICENNQYAVETHIERASVGGSIAERAAGFGLPSVQIDGQDVAAVYRATAEARELAACGGGPSFIEAVTYRYRGHNTGEVVNYRTSDEVEHWRRTRDPIERLRSSLEGSGRLARGEYDGMVSRAEAIVSDAIEFAESSPWPDPATAAEGVADFSFELRGPAWHSR